MRKEFALAFSFVLAISLPLLAQEEIPNSIDKEVLVNISAIPVLTEEKNIILIDQIGDQNQIFSFQENLSSGVNIAQLNQQGSLNQIYSAQIGSGIIHIINQIGRQNEAILNSNGYNIRLLVDQNGDNNYIRANFLNNNISSRLAQEGRDNIIELTAASFSTPTNLEISQKGNGQSFIDEGNFANQAYKVTQTPGFTGQGMEVRVRSY